jgi:hypothetical protein
MAAGSKHTAMRSAEMKRRAEALSAVNPPEIQGRAYDFSLVNPAVPEHAPQA